MIKKWIYDKFNNKYDFNVYDITEFDDSILYQILENNCDKRKANRHKNSNSYRKVVNYTQIKSGKYPLSYAKIYCGFDIETSKIETENGAQSFMYHWQFSLFNNVITGRYWDDFLKLLEMLKKIQEKESQKIVVWVANLGYEFQFLKYRLNITDGFLKAEREPIYIEHNNFIVFRECLSWGGSLSKLADDYTCLKKLKGDLDFSILRTPKSKIDNKGLMYCYMDVLILTEFSKWFFAEYFEKRKNPITVQGAIRINIKHSIKDINRVKRFICDCMPLTENDYNNAVNWLYRGGYVHANIKYCDNLFIKVPIKSRDITSSYPASMCHCKFSMKWHKSRYVDESQLQNLIDEGFTFYGLFTLSNLKRKTTHSIESKSKCLFLSENCTIDNGRIAEADKLQVYLTHLDYEIYCKFYDFKIENVIDFNISFLQKLPKYLVSNMCENYKNKAILKAKKLPYAIEKTYTNSYYGVCVTKRITQELKIENGDVTKTISEMPYWKYKRKQILSAFWGIYISAYSRHKLLSMVYDLEMNGNPVLYCDTDSIKYIEKNAKADEIFKKANAKMRLMNKSFCNDNNLDFEIFKDLGEWDLECNGNYLETFKTLGAKRYAYTYIDKGVRHYNITVAGLPKEKYYKLYAKNLMLFYKNFNEDLVVKNCKLASKYNDDEFTMIVNGEVINEKSNIALVDCDFSMKVKEEWLQMIYELATSKYEFRNY